MSPILAQSRLPGFLPSTTTDISLEEMRKTIPDWLLSRRDFSRHYSRMKLKQNLDIGDICSQPAQSRSDDEKEAVFLWVYSKPFFSKMPRTIVRETCDRLITVKYQSKETIIIKGQEGNCMFIIYKGQVGIFVNELRVGQRSAGEVLGETALDTEKPRSADAVADDIVVVLKLKKIDYTSILLNLKKLEKYEYSKFLLKLEFFSKWSPPRIQTLSDNLIGSKYLKGDIIYECNWESSGIYIILSGSVVLQTYCEVTKQNMWPTGLKKWEVQKVKNTFLVEIGRLESGGIFGIEAINNTLRVSQAIAEADTTCLILNKNECIELFTAADLRRITAYHIPVPTEEELQVKIKGRALSKTERVRSI